MKGRLTNLFWFSVDHGPTLMTIGFSSYVIALSQTSKIPTDIVLQWILAILGLLAVSELTERLRRIRRIEENTKKALHTIENKFGERASASSFFMKKLPRLDPYLEKASKVCCTGVTLQKMTREHIHTFAELLQDGALIQIIIVNPDSEAAKQVSEAGVSYPIEMLKANAHSTITNISWLSSLPESKGKIELKMIDEHIHFNTLSIDPDKDRGIIFIEMTSQRWVSRNRPRFELTRRRDHFWFNYFQNQFDKVWDDARPVSLNKVTNSGS